MTSPRRFTLLDAIILVAAFAIGFGWVRAIEARESRHPLFVTRLVLIEMALTRLEKGWRIAEAYLPCVASLTLAVAVLGVVRPSPGRARLSRRPGFVATAAASVALAAGAIHTAIGTLREIVQARWRFHPANQPYEFVWSESVVPTVNPAMCGLAVAAGWFLLAFGRRWRAVPDWLDRAGRCLGLFWLAWAAIDSIEPWGFIDWVTIQIFKDG